MASAAQILANQSNALHSTGPRTAAGKARVARNAQTHGLTARHLVVPEHDRAEFEELQASLLTELDPQGAIETLTFNNLLHAAWNLLRFRKIESSLMVNDLDPVLDDSSEKTIERLSRYAARAERAYYKALNELRTLQTNRTLRAAKLNTEQQESTPAIVAINELTKQTRSEVVAEAIAITEKLTNVQVNTLRSDAFLRATNQPRRDRRGLEALECVSPA